MGGRSWGRISKSDEKGHPVVRLTGEVSLENNGGFLQMAFDTDTLGNCDSAANWSGVAFEAKGNGERYEVRLRTSQLTKPWQSYRSDFSTSASWRPIKIAFNSFTPHRTTRAFDPSYLRRIGVLAIGAAFSADVSIRAFSLYR